MRSKSHHKSIRITITTTEPVQRHLRSLVPLGLYGSTVAEVAERLICEQLRGDLKKYRATLLAQNVDLV